MENKFEKNLIEIRAKSVEFELKQKGVDIKLYDWDQCIADQIERYGDEDTANKVCGYIKSQAG